MSFKIIFGDIHGCSKSCKKAIEIAENKNFQTIFLGDYIDRGPDSVQTLVELIKAKKRNPNWIFLKGNHESMLSDIISNNNLINKNGSLKSGTYFSYFETSSTFKSIMRSDLINISEVKGFIDDLLYYHETSNCIFVHAVLNNDTVSINCKDQELLLWNYNHKPEWTIKHFIHGHDRVNSILNNGKRININTSCGFGGHLTGIVVDDFNNVCEIIKISEDGNYF